MEIIVAKHAGFCKGVQDAVNLALTESKGKKAPLCTLGPLVHNEAVVDKLSSQGITNFDDVDLIPKEYLVLIRSHGVSPQTLEKITANHQESLDATCPIVKRVQNIAQRAGQAGKQVIIVGNPSHPEVVGIKGWAGHNARVIEGEEDINLDIIEEDAVVVAQTTLIPADFLKVVTKIKDLKPHIQVEDTICKSTVRRQKEAMEIASQVDMMLVIGGKSSSNTQKLAKLCRDIGTKTYLIASSQEIDSIRGWAKIRKVGVTAGASTPDWTIKEVIGKMEKKENEVLEEKEGLEEQEAVETPVETESVQAEKAQESAEVAAEAEVVDAEETVEVAQDAPAAQEDVYQEEIKTFEEGERVQGKVVQVTEEEVLVDIGYKSEGILPRSEIHLGQKESLEEVVNVGDTLDLSVEKIVDEEGKIILSKKNLDRKQAWATLEEAMENKTTLKGRVKEAVQAGIIVDLGAGLEGFMPGSLVDTKYIPDFNEFLGQEVEFKVIEINLEKVKVILSRKMVLEGALASKKQETLEGLVEGEVITGEVKRLTDFGAFVDVGGIDGLVHISEISWKRIDHPRDVMKVGEKVQVKVLEVIPEKERIGLSLRQAQPDPWSVVDNKYVPGDKVTGKVTRLVNFGAFVELLPGVEGLVHISQIADFHVKHPSEMLQEGQEIKVKILDINLKAKRISLSVKEAQEQKAKGSAPISVSTDDGSGSGVTLGDVFGDLFDKEDKEE